MAAIEVPPLIEILATIPDKRESQGKRHALAGMLALGHWSQVKQISKLSSIS